MDLAQLKTSEIRWQVSQPERIKPSLQAPVVTDQVCVATWRCSSRSPKYFYEGLAAAFDPQTGEQIWSIDDQVLYFAPEITPYGVLIGSMFGDLRMVDPLTGAANWHLQLPDENQSLGWACGDGIVVAGCYHDDTRLWAYDASSGADAWQVTTEGAPQRLIVQGDALFHLENVDDQTVAVRRELGTGAEVWRRPLDGWPCGVAVLDTPNRVVVVSTRAGCWTLSIDDGSPIAQIGWPDGVADVSLGAHDGAQIVGEARPWKSQSALVLLEVSDLSEPRVRWSQTEPKPSVGAAFLGAAQLLTQSETGRVSVRSREFGDEVSMWNPKTKKGRSGGFAAHGDLLYCAIGDTLFCLRPPS